MLGSHPEEEIRCDVLGKLGAWGRNRGRGGVMETSGYRLLSFGKDGDGE